MQRRIPREISGKNPERNNERFPQRDNEGLWQEGGAQAASPTSHPTNNALAVTQSGVATAREGLVGHSVAPGVISEDARSVPLFATADTMGIGAVVWTGL